MTCGQPDVRSLPSLVFVSRNCLENFYKQNLFVELILSCAMGITRTTASVAVALSLASAAYAQEGLKGEIATVDRASGIIGIKLIGTVGSSDATAPTPFKVQDA